MSKNVNKRFSALLNEKKIKWDEIKSIIASNATLESIRRQALKKACLDTSICKSTLKLLLQKTDVDVDQRVKLVMAAVRCENMSAITTLIYDDISVLYVEVSRGRRQTLLHLVCEKHGWNREVQFVLKETLENRDKEEHRHEGMFQLNSKMQTPFKLALQAGCDLETVVCHLREEFPSYFQSNLKLLPEIMAEYCVDMSLLEELIMHHPRILRTNKDNSTPFHHACYYQNGEMIRVLLGYYLRKGDRRKKILSRLLTLNNENMTPIGHLVMGLGSMDSYNAFDCVRIIMGMAENLHILPMVIDKDQMWDHLVREKVCLQTVKRIVEWLNVDVSSETDDHRRTVLSLLISKMSSSTSEELSESIQVLEYILSNCDDVANLRDGKKRLPLHVACDCGLRWDFGMKQIVNANIFALEEVDSKSTLLPFALAATSTCCDLNTIYQLLRYNPIVI